MLEFDPGPKCTSFHCGEAPEDSYASTSEPEPVDEPDAAAGRATHTAIGDLVALARSLLATIARKEAAPTVPDIVAEASASAAETIRACELYIIALEEDLHVEQDSESRIELELFAREASTWLQHLRELMPLTNRETKRNTKARKGSGWFGG